jgi:hypothetical protein
MILTSLRIDADSFTQGTGWQPKPEGLCRGEVCVPAPGALGADDTIDVESAAARLGMPLVADADRGLWALGPATLSGRALATAQAADPALVDRRGREFRLSSLRGRKVVMVAWSTY